MATNPQKPEKKNHTGKVLKGSPRGTEERVCALKSLRKESADESRAGEAVGFLVGTWTPKDSHGEPLGKTFNVFAAPQSLKTGAGGELSLKFNEAAQHMTQLKGWHGHDGAHYSDDAAFHQALIDGNYKGEWIMPTWEMLSGEKFEWRSESLYNGGRKPELQAFFSERSSQGEWFWLNTRHHFHTLFQQVICLASGYESWMSADTNRKQCWPVRLVEVKPGV